MIKNKTQHLLSAVVLLLFVLFLLAENSSFILAAETGDNSEQESQPNGSNLRGLIEQKSAELQKIQEEREVLEKNLKEVNKTQSSLKKEIGGINYTINQLDLSIKSNKVIIEKLGLEIEALNSDMNQIEKRVNGNKEAISRLMIRLYERDQDGLFMAFLRNGTLAEGVSEIQSLMTINGDLSIRTNELREFQKELVRKSAYVQDKKQSREVEKENLTNRQYIIKDQKETKRRLLVQTKNQEETYVNEIEKLEKQQEEISQVIDEIENQLRTSFDPSLLPLKRPGVFGYPVENPRLTQKYGRTSFAAKAYKTKSHTGVDFAVSIGTPILASEDGKVKAVGNNDRGTVKWQKFQYGKHIVIEHNNNLTTLYAHLSRAVVNIGDEVKRGDIVGYSGNTGYSTGPHIHFGVYWSPSVRFQVIPPAAGLVLVGITIDPEEYLAYAAVNN